MTEAQPLRREPAIGPEGGIRIRLVVAGGRVAQCQIVSTRPDVAGGLLQGRKVGEIAAAVPRLFAICGASQAVACELALAAANGSQVDAGLLERGNATVAAETLRETTRHILLDWPRALGEAPAAEAVAAARRVMDPAAAPEARASAVAQAVFGGPLAEWLVCDSPSALAAWAAGGATAAGRVLQAGRATPVAPATVALLDSPPGAGLLAAIAHQARASPSFARAPLSKGLPAETGALARMSRDPLVAAWLAQGAASRTVARLVARLREAALLLADATPLRVGTAPARAGARPLGDGWGLGWAENARGLLVHLAQVEQGRALQYRIVAPTEWNFHPAGALAAAIIGAEAENAQDLRNRMVWLIDSLDPCVHCEIEIHHA